jgi:hypothetical protein
MESVWEPLGVPVARTSERLRASELGANLPALSGAGKENTMSIENLIVDLEESVELPEAGANVGGFPCGVVGGVVYILV